MKNPSLFNLLSKLESNEFTQYKHIYVDICEDLVAGILLSKIIYWLGKGKDGKTRAKGIHQGRECLIKMRSEWWEECRISERSYDRSMKKLQDLGFVTSEVHKSSFHDFQTACFIFVNELALEEAIVSYLKKEIDNESTVIPESPNGNSGNSELPNGDSRNDESVIPGNYQTVIPYIPRSLPRSLFNDYIDLGQKTLACSTKNDKTLDVAKRWKLTEDQLATFQWLKSKEIDAKDEKLCFWSKTHSLERLIDVYNEAIHNEARSLRLYMGKLLDENKTVFNARIKANADLARDFVKTHGWGSLKINKKYLTFMLGGDKQEINLDMEPTEFLRRLTEKFEYVEKYG